MNECLEQRMKATVAELQEERAVVADLLG